MKKKKRQLEFLFLYFRWDIYIFLIHFFFSLAVEIHGNKSLYSCKCPHSILDRIFNKGTVSCKEYYISLIVLQIPFLIKTKIFIIITCKYVFFLAYLEDYALDTNFIYLFFLRKGVALVRKIYSNWFCFFGAPAITPPKK
jgi:hypothetical protein